MHLGTGTVLLMCAHALVMCRSARIGECIQEAPNDPPPQSVLPQYDNDLNTHQPSLRTIKEEYDKGMGKCLQELDDYGAPHRDKRPNQADSVLGEQCRGHAALHHVAGVVLMPFGPAECELHSQCWLGVLSCGSPHGDSIRIDELSGCNYSGWSVGSLHIQIVVQGREIVVPTQRLITHRNSTRTRNTADPLTEASFNIAHGMDAIIGTYAMSIPGEYSVEMRLHGWYRGRLFRSLADAAFEESDIIGYEHLGGIQFRCKPYKACPMPYACCGCIERSFVPQTPMSLTVQNSNRCPPWTDRPLPVCKGGSNVGRYISLPPSVTRICRADKYLETMANAYQDTTNRSQWVRYTGNIKKEYLNMISSINASHVWNQLLGPSPDASESARTYLAVLSLYASGNPCQLLDLRPNVDTNLGAAAIYAPYRCRYIVYSVADTLSCSQSARHLPVPDRHSRNFNMLFDGDSMARELFAAVLFQYNRAELSSTALKTELNRNLNISRRGKATLYVSSEKGADLNLLYSWEFLKRNLNKAVKLRPNVYVTNFGMMHNIAFNSNRHEFLRTFDGNITAFWLNKSAYFPPLRIFQNARDNHGMRDPRFISELIRRSNSLLESRFVGRLGFQLLNEYLLTAGVLERGNWYNDGWHVEFEGVARKVQAIILMNIICNQ